MGFRVGRRYVRIATNGIDNDFTYDETPESESQLLEIVQEWLSTRRQTAFSLADTDDFVPLSFLEMGAKRSQAVCRIARYLSLADFQELLEAFRDAPNSQDYTADNLISILGIPEQLVSEIFGPEGLKQKQELSAQTVISVILEKINNGQINDNHLMRINPVPVGTGFLVGGSHLITNNHVIETPEDAESCVAQFNYVQDALGGSPTVIEYELDPEVLFVTNPNLDYTLVQLKSGISTRPAGFQFGWLQLSGNSTNVCPKLSLASIASPQEPNLIKILEGNQPLPGDRLFLIQHPKGRRQEFNPSGSTVKDYAENGLLRNFLRYSGTSDYGASCSAVFNERW
jgi:hypothetical protein